MICRLNTVPVVAGYMHDRSEVDAPGVGMKVESALWQRLSDIVR